MKSVDVVVWGGGPAGLIAAILLARRGMETVVLDTSEPDRPDRWEWRTDSVSFDNLPSLMPGLGEGEPIATLLGDLGLPVDLMRRKGTDFWMVDPPIQVILPNLRMDLPSEPSMLLREIGRLFPEEVKGFSRFLEDSQPLEKEIYQVLMRYPNLIAEGWERILPSVLLRRNFSLVASIRHVSFRDYLSQYIHDPSLILVMDILARNLVGRGVDGPLFFGLAALGILRRGFWYMGGGIGVLRQTLLSFLNKLSSRGVINSPVTRVEGEGKGPPRIITPNEIYQPRVAFIIDQPMVEARRLLGIPPGSLPSRWSRIIQYRTIPVPSRPGPMAPLVLTASNEQMGLVSPVEIFASPSRDNLRQAKGLCAVTISQVVPPSHVPLAGKPLSLLWNRLFPFVSDKETLSKDTIVPYHPFPSQDPNFPIPLGKIALPGKERLGSGKVYLVGRDAFPGPNIMFETLSALRVVAELAKL